MNFRFCLIAPLLLAGQLVAASWNTYTNTNHVSDLEVYANEIYFGTWGGAVKLKTGDQSWNPYQDRLWITKDGISSNEISTVEYIPASGNLWLGTLNHGISIVNSGSLQLINDTNGLPSNKIRKIIAYDQHIYVATDLGLSVFFYLEGVNFPLLLNQYNNQNTHGALVSNDIQDMALDHQNYLYFATPEGISYVHTDSLEIGSAWNSWTSVNSVLTPGSPARITLNQNQIAMSFVNKVYVHPLAGTGDSWAAYGSGDLLINHQISALGIDNDNGLYVAYGTWDEDLLLYSRTIDTLYTYISPEEVGSHIFINTQGLAEATISNIKNYEGSLYLCTWGDGIYKQQDDNWLAYQSNCIGFPKITDIETDQNQKLWFSSGYLSSAPSKKGSLGVSSFSGGTWESFNQANSPIHSDNIISIATDSHNRKWFGTWATSPASQPGWLNGVGIYDEETGIWKRINHEGIRIYDAVIGDWGSVIPGSGRLLGNTIGAIAQDQNENMLVACYDLGVVVFDDEDNRIATFQIPNSNNQRVIYISNSGGKYFFGTFNDRGLVIWNDDSLPVTGGSHWLVPTPSMLSNCEVYGVVTVDTPYEGRQHWIAASTGVFMWNEQDWYRYDTAIKRLIFRNNEWQNETLYYVDEERLFGSVRTFPTAIIKDPFNRIWIGSMDNGFSMYDPYTERFVNYYQ
ncbi:MAG: hypothetical protein PHI68_08550, partial [Candidatus Cloacimonetes bacterium]|nr:hypothetical protein [Candidatus Cloacimonadota bacterium]